MWPFTIRSEPQEEKQEDGSLEDTLLRASLSEDYMTKEQAMNVPSYAACVNMISETVSELPVKLYRTVDGKLEEIKEDARTRLLNEDTGDTLDGVQFKRAMVRDYLTGRGGYAYINRAGNRVKSLHYVKEGEISFQCATDPIFKDYDVLVNGIRYKPFQFLKILRNTENGYSGKSTVDENRQILSVAYHSLLYEKNLVKTGGNKKGFVKAQKKLSQTAVDALKAAWRRLYQNNTESVVILNDGLEFQEASSTSIEMQMNENKTSNSEEICKIFNMPPGMIRGGATEQDRTDFIQYCLNPVLAVIECALNRDLLLEKEKGLFYFAVDTSDLTRGDIEKRFRAYETAKKNGFMQIDEIRMKENLPPLGLDFICLGLQDVLYYPESKEYYTPNMDSNGKLGKLDGKTGKPDGKPDVGRTEGQEGGVEEDED